jgi:O-methyltransferase domain
VKCPEHGLSDRIRFRAGDFFADPLPSADVLVMGHVLHDWALDQKMTLIEKVLRGFTARRCIDRL